MAIVDDYASIAAELRRLKDRRPRDLAEAEDQRQPPSAASRHPMRATPAGERLYQRLIFRGRR